MKARRDEDNGKYNQERRRRTAKLPMTPEEAPKRAVPAMILSVIELTLQEDEAASNGSCAGDCGCASDCRCGNGCADGCCCDSGWGNCLGDCCLGDAWTLSSCLTPNCCNGGFCGACGTPLTMQVDHQGEPIDFSIATLDDPDPVAPGFHIFRSSRVAWFETADDLPRHEHAHLPLEHDVEHPVGIALLADHLAVLQAPQKHRLPALLRQLLHIARRRVIEVGVLQKAGPELPQARAQAVRALFLAPDHAVVLLERHEDAEERALRNRGTPPHLGQRLPPRLLGQKVHHLQGALDGRDDVAFAHFICEIAFLL